MFYVFYVHVWGHRGLYSAHWKAKGLSSCYPPLLCKHAYKGTDLHILSKLIMWYLSLVCTAHLPQLEGTKYILIFCTRLSRVWSIMRSLPLSRIQQGPLEISLDSIFPFWYWHWSSLEDWSSLPFLSIKYKPFISCYPCLSKAASSDHLALSLHLP